ncbi:hypothetical protein F5X97DRAFT_81197 [Nemania serpens]|nr:hypothetical protein F5X97DRAFT_81197 [Nemania serpens]
MEIPFNIAITSRTAKNNNTCRPIPVSSSKCTSILTSAVAAAALVPIACIAGVRCDSVRLRRTVRLGRTCPHERALFGQRACCHSLEPAPTSLDLGFRLSGGRGRVSTRCANQPSALRDLEQKVVLAKIDDDDYDDDVRLWCQSHKRRGFETTTTDRRLTTEPSINTNTDTTTTTTTTTTATATTTATQFHPPQLAGY